VKIPAFGRNLVAFIHEVGIVVRTHISDTRLKVRSQQH